MGESILVARPTPAPIEIDPPRDLGSAPGVFKKLKRDLDRIHAFQVGADLDLTALESGGVSATVSAGVTAAQVIAVDDVVTALGQVADRTIPAHAGRVLGIALNASGIGGTVQVAVAGPASLAGFSAGQILWLNTAGALTTTPPLSGFQQRVAVALSNTLVVVSLDVPIVLA